MNSYNWSDRYKYFADNDEKWLESELIKAEQSDDANLIIGLGGSGYRTISAVRDEVFVNIAPDTVAKEDSLEAAYPRIRFLYIDREEEVQRRKGAPLTTVLSLGRYQYKKLFDFDEKEIFREAARIDFAEKCRELPGLISRFAENNKNRRIHVHIVAGISGNVGSGVFLSLAFLVKAVLNHYVIDPEIYGYFLMQSNIGGGSPKLENEHMAFNIMSALLELDYCARITNEVLFMAPAVPDRYFARLPYKYYFLVPANDPSERNNASGTVAGYILQYIKKETAGSLNTGDLRSAEAILGNTSAGKFLVFLQGKKSFKYKVQVRVECAGFLYSLMERRRTEESVELGKSILAKKYNLNVLISKLEVPLDISFTEIKEELWKKTADMQQIQDAYDCYTTDLLTTLAQEKPSFVDSTTKDYMLAIHDCSDNLYACSELVEASIHLLDEWIVTASNHEKSYIKKAFFVLSDSQEKWIHSSFLSRRREYQRYLNALEDLKKAQIYERATEIVIEVWKNIIFTLHELKKTSIDKALRVMDESMEYLSYESSLPVNTVKNTILFEKEAENRFSVLISEFEQDLLGRIQQNPADDMPTGRSLARYLIDQAAAYAVETLSASEDYSPEDMIQNAPLHPLFWRKDEPDSEYAPVIFLQLPEEKHFAEKWVKELEARYVVIPVITHRPGSAEWYGFRIIPQLFNKEMDLDYLHTLRIEGQDAAVWMRDRVIRRMFSAQSVSEPEKAYVSRVRSLQIPENASEPVRHTLTDFEAITHLSVPVEIALKEKDLLDGLNQLESVRLSGDGKADLSHLYFPKTLRELDFQGLFMHELPEALTGLRKLEKLDLQDVHLDTMSSSILDLAERIGFTAEEHDTGICIKNLVIEDMNSSILLGPIDTLRMWFEKREIVDVDGIAEGRAVNSIGEIKVIFLGDGEVGKTRTIRRILRDGEQFEYTEDRTPGILISDRVCRINDRDIKIHFWDFGGQDIFYSTHRMFMTRQTLYVILLNARESNLDERARYWLYNVTHFAGKDAPVLLVINKTDLNEDAYINSSLREEYKKNICGVSRLSNETFDKERFRKAIIEPLYRIIDGMKPVANDFPASWRLLADRMQKSKELFLRESDVRKMLPDSMKNISHKELGDLLEWFNQIGVSFCYRNELGLADFIVLDPHWVTNAIYIILANGRKYTRHGLLKSGDLSELLLEEKGSDKEQRKEESKVIICVDPTIHYRDLGEVSFVLGVIRYFHLSFRIDTNTEFIPALCTKDTCTRCEEIQKDSKALHFKYEYEYLPRLILHRLMVELHVYLDIESVARDAAVFELRERGLAAAVSIRGKTLHIYIVCKEPGTAPGVFLEILRESLANINDTFDFSPKEFIVYTENGKSADFDFNELMSMREHSSSNKVYSSVFKRDIYLTQLLNPISQEEKMWMALKRDLVSACLNLQSHEQAKFGDEVKCNVYLCDQLRMSGRNAVTEHLGGRSGSGKTDNYGERDITVFDEDNREQFILEGLILSYKQIKDSRGKYLNKDYLKKHLEKLLNNYNPNGLQDLCIINYVDTDAAEFMNAWEDYLKCIRQENPGSYIAQNTIEETNEINNFIRTAETRYSVGGAFAKVYHIFMMTEKCAK